MRLKYRYFEKIKSEYSLIIGNKGAVPRFARFAEKVWGICESDEEKAALLGIEKTVDFFKSIGMPVSLKELGIDPSDADLEALSLDATMQGTVMLSRIRPLDANDVKKIYEAARK